MLKPQGSGLPPSLLRELSAARSVCRSRSYLVVFSVSFRLGTVVTLATSDLRGHLCVVLPQRPQHGLRHEGVLLLFLELDDGGVLLAFLGLVVGVVSVPKLASSSGFFG